MCQPIWRHGTGNANITAIDPGPLASAAVKLPITAATPAISTGGVVPIYSAATVIQAGSWVSIYGTGLANTAAVWTGNFPTTPGGTSVKIDNKLAYLLVRQPDADQLAGSCRFRHGHRKRSRDDRRGFLHIHRYTRCFWAVIQPASWKQLRGDRNPDPIRIGRIRRRRV